MSVEGVTFGQAISKARKALGLSQKELAARVMKRRRPARYHRNTSTTSSATGAVQARGPLIRQFSGILNIPEDYLFALAGRLLMTCGPTHPTRTGSLPHS